MIASTTLSTLSILLFSLTFACAQTSFELTNVVITSTTSSPFSPNGPSSNFASQTLTDAPTATGNSESLVPAFQETTFPPTMTTCFITATGTYPATTEGLNPEASDLPPGAECFVIIRESGVILEPSLLTVLPDGSTLFASDSSLATSSPAASSSSSSSSKATGTIVGAVIGSVFGTLFIGATLLWIRRQRRSSKASGTWFNRPAGWVQNEKQANHIEMTRRTAA